MGNETTDTPQLTPKQRLFVAAYLETFNATEAAARAGYKGDRNTLSSIGSENLRKPAIRSAIDAEVAEHPIIASKGVRLRYLVSVLDDKVTGDVMTAEGVDTVGPTVGHKLRAIELISKACGDYVERSELHGDVNIRFVDEGFDPDGDEDGD